MTLKGSYWVEFIFMQVTQVLTNLLICFYYPLVSHCLNKLHFELCVNSFMLVHFNMKVLVLKTSSLIINNYLRINEDLMKGNPTNLVEEQEGMVRVKRAVGGFHCSTKGICKNKNCCNRKKYIELSGDDKLFCRWHCIWSGSPVGWVDSSKTNPIIPLCLCWSFLNSPVYYRAPVRPPSRRRRQRRRRQWRK